MAKPPRKEFNLQERIARIRKAGLTVTGDDRQNPGVTDKGDPDLLPLSERIRLILGIIRDQPIKATTMNYLVLYDIENNKVRTLIAKYLIAKGCIRIQKSVFLAHSNHKKFDEIRQTLAEINGVYENRDSIILVPLNISDARSMKLIGHNVDIDRIIDPPNTVFI
jgi:CRISPR-associated endonuclease Cas2